MTTIYAADLFCGAGGTSNGLVHAAKKLGYELDLLAINHWQVAIATHSANYPWATHMCENLDNVDPRKVVPDGHLDLLVASPECTHHSRARGGRPISDQSRASAWHVLRWAEALYIENILIENVPEFMTWGPVDQEGKPVQRLKGKTYLAFIGALESLGYNVDARVVNAADYGDPTTRKRLFIMARRSQPVVWPEPSHAKRDQKDMYRSVKPWTAAREIIDWTLESASIFSRKKALSPNTMRRIMKGLQKFSGLPFIVGQQSGNAPRSVEDPIMTVTTTSRGIGLAEPFLVQYHGDSYEGGERVRSVDDPFPTVATNNQLALCEPFIVTLNHGQDDARSYDLGNPMPTVTSVDAWGLVEPFLVKYNGTGGPMSVDDPLDTVTGKDRFGLVIPMADGRQAIIDIKFRMLQPHELAAAMSFPHDYQFTGKRDEKVKQIGNAVPGKLAEALITSLIQAPA